VLVIEEITLEYHGNPEGISVEIVPAALPVFDAEVVAPITMY
jgi:hypothetical protein